MSTYEGVRHGDMSKLVGLLKDEQLRKRDLVVPSRFLRMADGKVVIDDIPNGMFKEQSIQKLIEDFNIEGDLHLQFDPMKNAESNISQKLSIPMTYYRFLKEHHEDMLDWNVSELFARGEKPFFVRTFAPSNGSSEGVLRALLSDRYKVIDHLDILTTTLKAIKDSGVNVEVGRCNLTETSMYVEFFSPEVQTDYKDFIRNYKAPNGDGNGAVMAGFVISNSEVGAGKYKIQPRAILTVCNNGMIRRADAMEHTHLGSKMESNIIWSPETKRKELELILSQVHDAVGMFISPDYLGKFVEEIFPHTDRLSSPIPALKNVCSHLAISDDEQADVLNYFLDSGDFSSFGAVQSLTYFAQTVSNADRQYEIETKSFELMPSIRDRFDEELVSV